MSHLRIVVCRLHSFDLEAAFLELSREFRAWIIEQPGFEAYELVGAGAEWTDRAQWRDSQAADDSDRAFAATTLPARFGALVESYLGAAGVPVALGP